MRSTWVLGQKNGFLLQEPSLQYIEADLILPALHIDFLHLHNFIYFYFSYEKKIKVPFNGNFFFLYGYKP